MASEADTQKKSEKTDLPPPSYEQSEGIREELARNFQFEMEEKQLIIQRICEMVGYGNEQERPLHVAFVGCNGAGKSSLINTIAAALSEGRWREYAMCGIHANGAPITIFSSRYDKCCHASNQNFPYKDYNLPSLIDIAGQVDDGADKLEELFRLVFYGHIEEEGAIMSAFEFCQRHSVEEIRAVYSNEYPDMKVDRVVFVASAKNDIPELLIKRVLSAARPHHYHGVRRSIPVFGVLTHLDKVDNTSTSFREKEDKFKLCLGVSNNRYLRCVNYCDDIDPLCERTTKLDLDIDLPVLKFLEQVCDPSMRTIQADERLPRSNRPEAENEQPRPPLTEQPTIGSLLQREMYRMIPALKRVDPMLLNGVLSAFVAFGVWLVLNVVQLDSSVRSHLQKVCQMPNVNRVEEIKDLCLVFSSSNPGLYAILIAVALFVGIFVILVTRSRS